MVKFSIVWKFFDKKLRSKGAWRENVLNMQNGQRHKKGSWRRAKLFPTQRQDLIAIWSSCAQMLSCLAHMHYITVLTSCMSKGDGILTGTRSLKGKTRLWKMFCQMEDNVAFDSEKVKQFMNLRTNLETIKTI